MAKTRKLQNETKNRILQVSLEMIVENKTSTTLNLREIARKAGCAHTNLYNYFHDLDDLRWQCLVPAYKRLTGQSDFGQLNPLIRGLAQFRHFMEAYIEAIIENPGLYRFLMFEDIPGEIPQEVQSGLAEINNNFSEVIRIGGEGKISEYQLERLQDLIMAYFHGEMANLIGRKTFRAFPAAQQKEEIIQNCVLLYDAFKRL